MIDITGLDKAALLLALYQSARPVGLGHLIFTIAPPLTYKVAVGLLTERTSFDYINGRSCKVDLRDDTFDPWLYDRDNGEGAAARIIAQLRTK